MLMHLDGFGSAEISSDRGFGRLPSVFENRPVIAPPD